MFLFILAYVFFNGQARAGYDPENYGYKCIIKEIHGQHFRACGNMIRPPRQHAECIRYTFITPVTGVHSMETVCYWFDIDIEIKGA